MRLVTLAATLALAVAAAPPSVAAPLVSLTIGGTTYASNPDASRVPDPVEAFDGSPLTPPGGITGPLVVVPVDATPGCEDSDYARLTAVGAVVLVSRGACPFWRKVDVAAAAGAIAILIYDNLPSSGSTGTVETSDAIPSLFLTQALGASLTGLAGRAVTLSVQAAPPTGVPEPSSLLLLGGALVGLSASRRRPSGAAAPVTAAAAPDASPAPARIVAA